MPTYTIQIPNGQQVEIAADTPDAAMAGAQQYWQKNPDPKGAAQYQAALADAQASNKRMGGGGGWENLVNGAMLGWGDELDGMGAANQVRLQNIGASLGLGKAPAYTPDQAYRAQVQVDRGVMANYRSSNPGGALATGVAGGFMTPGVGELAGWAGGAPRLGSAMVRGAALGAGLGAASGAGNADDGQRIAGAAQGALAGGALGAAAPVAGKVASAVGTPVVRGLNNAWGATTKALTGDASYFLNPDQQSMQVVARALRADGATPESMASILNQLQDTGVDSSLMDVASKLPNGGQNTLALLRGAAMNSPSARGIVGRYRQGIEGNLQDNAIQHTYGLTPTDQRGATDVLNAMQDQHDQLTNLQYQAPYAQQIDAGPILPALGGQAGAKAVNAAATEADAMSATDPVIADRLPQLKALQRATTFEPPRLPDATTTGDPDADAWAQRLLKASGVPSKSPPKVDLGTLDRIKVALNNMGDDAAARGLGGTAAGYYQRAQLIDDHLAASSPAYGAARDAYAARAQAIDALKAGMGGYGKTPDQLAAATARNLGTGGVGYRQALVDQIAAPGANATGTLNKLATSTGQGQKLAGLYGSDAARAYRQAIGDELSRLETARAIDPSIGSPTAVRGADALSEGVDLVSTAADLKTGGGVLRALAKFAKGQALNDQERQAVLKLALGDARSGLQALPPMRGSSSPSNMALPPMLAQGGASQPQNDNMGVAAPPTRSGPPARPSVAPAAALTTSFPGLPVKSDVSRRGPPMKRGT